MIGRIWYIVSSIGRSCSQAKKKQKSNIILLLQNYEIFKILHLSIKSWNVLTSFLKYQKLEKKVLLQMNWAFVEIKKKLIVQIYLITFQKLYFALVHPVVRTRCSEKIFTLQIYALIGYLQLYKCHILRRVIQQICQNSEYVHRIQIEPQMNNTEPLKWDLTEVAPQAHPNSICNFEVYRG